MLICTAMVDKIKIMAFIKINDGSFCIRHIFHDFINVIIQNAQPVYVDVSVFFTFFGGVAFVRPHEIQYFWKVLDVTF